MKVVVTGAAGRAGRWVVEELVSPADGSPGHELTLVDRVPVTPLPGVRAIAGDVCDLGQVYGLLAGADAVVHLAAVGRPGVTTDDVLFRTNVVSTFNVHEAAYQLGVRKVVSTSSESVLGWDYRTVDFLPDYLPVDEDHPARPQDAYGLSKLAGEEIARAYARRGLQTVILRPAWIALPGQLEQRRRDGGRTPTHFKTYGYVDARDVAVAFRLAVERDLPPATTLFVLADDSTLAEPLSDVLPRLYPACAKLAAKLQGSQAGASSARAKAALGWQPRFGWRNG